MYLTKKELARLRKRQALYAHLTRICRAIGMFLITLLFAAILCIGFVIA